MAQIMETEKGGDAEVLAQASKFFQEFEKVAKAMMEMAEKLKTFRANTISLVNLKESLGHELQQMEIRKSKIEAEIKIRLESVSRGHQVLIDRISKREIELSAKTKEIEAKEALLTVKLRDAELLLMQRERELEGTKAFKAAAEPAKAGAKGK